MAQQPGGFDPRAQSDRDCQRQSCSAQEQHRRSVEVVKKACKKGFPNRRPADAELRNNRKSACFLWSEVGRFSAPLSVRGIRRDAERESVDRRYGLYGIGRLYRVHPLRGRGVGLQNRRAHGALHRFGAGSATARTGGFYPGHRHFAGPGRSTPSSIGTRLASPLER